MDMGLKEPRVYLKEFWVYLAGNKAKGVSQNRCFKKTKHAIFSEKQTFLTPWYAHVQEIFVFRKIWSVLFSWKTRFEFCPSALLPTICKTN